MTQTTIDIGNTRTKIARFEEDQLIDFQVATEKDALKELIERTQSDACIVSSVANEDLTKFVISLVADPLVLSENTKLPIKNTYKTPHTLGKDRLANAVGAYRLFGETNCLIIDAGTCLKFDVLNGSKEYLGGSISPGLSMRFKALHTFTDKLPLVNPNEATAMHIGDDTLTAIHTGCYTGMNNEITATIDYFQQKFEDLKVILTGGDMEELQKMEFSQKNSIFADRWLTLRGLNEILRHNVKS